MKKRWTAGLLAGVMSLSVLTGCVPQKDDSWLSPAEIRVNVSHAISNSLPYVMSGLSGFAWDPDSSFEVSVLAAAELMKWCDQYLVEDVTGTTPQEAAQAMEQYASQLEYQDWCTVQRNWFLISDASMQLLDGSPEALQLLETVGWEDTASDMAPARWQTFQQAARQVFGTAEMENSLHYTMNFLHSWQVDPEASAYYAALHLIRWGVENDAANLSQTLLQNEMQRWYEGLGEYYVYNTMDNWPLVVMAGDGLAALAEDATRFVSEEDVALLEREDAAACWNAMKAGFLGPKTDYLAQKVLETMGGSSSINDRESIHEWSEKLLFFCTKYESQQMDPKRLESRLRYGYQTKAEGDQQTLADRWKDIEPYADQLSASLAQPENWPPVRQALQRVLGSKELTESLESCLVQVRDWALSNAAPSQKVNEAAQLVLLCQEQLFTQLGDNVIHHRMTSWYHGLDARGRYFMRVGWLEMRNLGDQLTAKRSPLRESLDLPDAQKQALAQAGRSWNTLKAQADEIFLLKNADGYRMPESQMESAAQLTQAIRQLALCEDLGQSEQDWLPVTADLVRAAALYGNDADPRWVQCILEDWYQNELTGDTKTTSRKNWAVVQSRWDTLLHPTEELQAAMEALEVPPVPQIREETWYSFAAAVEHIVIESQLKPELESFVYDITTWWADDWNASDYAIATAYEMLEWTLLDDESSITYQKGVLDRVWREVLSTTGPGKQSALRRNMGMVMQYGRKLVNQDYNAWMHSPNPGGYGTKHYDMSKWLALVSGLGVG